jgi:[acyl-carrier-protein] S-malonyltransferase
MAAMIGLPQEEAARICADLCSDGQVVGVAIHNAPNQVVISGHATAVDQAVALAKGQTAVQAVRLPISVPCHCSLLMDAAEQFRGDLERTPIGAFRFPVIPNCDPEVFHSREHTRDLLMRQITSPVRWRETVERMAALGIDTIVEVGPKKTLAGLIKRIDRRIRVLNVNDVESLQKTVAALTIS